jgi:hypothetical protein
LEVFLLPVASPVAEEMEEILQLLILLHLWEIAFLPILAKLASQHFWELIAMEIEYAMMLNDGLQRM